MAGSGFAAGGGGGGNNPAPWWQYSQPGTLENLQKSAPAGYQYDPVQMQYVRTPTSVGADIGSELKGLAGAAPGGVSSLLNNPVASGTTGSGAFGTTGNPATGAFPKVNFGGGTSGSTSGGSIGMGPGGPAPSLTLPDQSASIAAQFGTAKDQVGQETQGALRGLAGAMAGRGIVGSGVEGRGQLGVVNQGQQQLGETSRALAEQQAATAADFAKTRYGGEITQRGQDIGAQEAQLGAGVAQRGQDVGFAESQGQLGLGYSDLDLRRQMAALSALKGFNIGTPGGNLYGGTAAY